MNLAEMLTFDEGLRLDLYLDTEGYWTIGIGSLVTKNPSKTVAISVLDTKLSRKTNGKITDKEAQILFNQETQNTLRGILTSSLKDTYNGLDEVRRLALVNMVYQMGVAGVSGFRKMIANLNNKQFADAAKEALDSKWARQTPNRARRVTEVIRTGTLASYR